MRALWVWLGLVAPPPQIEEVPLGPRAEIEARADTLRAELREIDEELTVRRASSQVEISWCVQGLRDEIRALLVEIEAASTELSVYAPDDPRVASALRRARLADELAAERVAAVPRCSDIGCHWSSTTMRVEGPDDALAPEVAHHPESIERHRW